MNVDMAKRLADRRRNAGLSQESLAEKLGVTRQAVSKWERSESSPDTDNLIALAQLYGVSLDELLYGEVPEEGDASAVDADDADVGASSSTCADATGEGAAYEGATEGSADAAADADANAESDNAASGSASESWTAADRYARREARRDARAARERRREAHAHARENVHIGFDGVHVEDGGDYVHVGWDGVHVIDGSRGDQVHVGRDGVHINDRAYDFDSPHWHDDALRDFGIDPREKESAFLKAWKRFPFPLIVILAYILVAMFRGAGLEALMLVFTIPLYYQIGALIATRRVDRFVMSAYPLGAVAWFCYMAFCLNHPHPAWMILLTIPIVECLVVNASRWYHEHKRKKADAENVVNVCAIAPESNAAAPEGTAAEIETAESEPASSDARE